MKIEFDNIVTRDQIVIDTENSVSASDTPRELKDTLRRLTYAILAGLIGSRRRYQDEKLELLERLRDDAAEEYANRNGLSMDEVRSMMQEPVSVMFEPDLLEDLFVEDINRFTDDCRDSYSRHQLERIGRIGYDRQYIETSLRNAIDLELGPMLQARSADRTRKGHIRVFSASGAVALDMAVQDDRFLEESVVVPDLIDNPYGLTDVEVLDSLVPLQRCVSMDHHHGTVIEHRAHLSLVLHDEGGSTVLDTMVWENSTRSAMAILEKIVPGQIFMDRSYCTAPWSLSSMEYAEGRTRFPVSQLDGRMAAALIFKRFLERGNRSDCTVFIVDAAFFESQGVDMKEFRKFAGALTEKTFIRIIEL